jgi:hypothetical protein
MEPLKEIRIRLAERMDYSERIFLALFIFRTMPFVIYVLTLKIHQNGILLIFILALLCSLGLFILNIVKRKQGFFIKKLFVNSDDTVILYTFRNTDLVHYTMGKTSDFRFEIKFDSLLRGKHDPGMYISISYQGKEVIRQYEIDNWAKQDLRQVVKDICQLKGEKFSMPAYFPLSYNYKKDYFFGKWSEL